MRELPPSLARTTTTLYSYAEQLAAEQVPRGASLLLGLRWSFGLPSSPLEEIHEFSLPLNPVPLPEVLAERGGLRIVVHEEDSLERHLATGQAAIVAIDAFYFPFRPAYRRVHSSRTVRVSCGSPYGQIQVWDGWGPPAEGTVSPDELHAARFSSVPLDVGREPLFSGNPVHGAWFSVEARPLRVEDATAWARERLAWLADEMATPRVDERGEYGIQALRRFQRNLSEELSNGDGVNARRGASLLLRPELSSRLYLGVFLRNAAHLLGDEELRLTVERYRAALGHWQAAMDVLTKTIRTRRPEYDDFIRDQFARACDHEERLLQTLSRYSP